MHCRTMHTLGMVAGISAGVACSVGPLGSLADAAPTIEAGDTGKASATNILAHTVKRIDGAEESLSAYKGKVLVIVNVASKCGFTPQYTGLQKLYESKKDAGLVVLGFPANNFNNQEPGSDDEIMEFCKSKYSVTFPMFSKISVKGDDKHPLFKQLTSLPEPLGGEIRWNFEKFVVDREGNVIGHFGSRVKPDDAEMTELIDKALAQPSGKP